VQCAESLRVQAYFDGEVDAVTAAELERHAERCAECRALLGDLKAMRSALRQELPRDSAPPQLRARVLRALDVESRKSAASAKPSRRAPWRLPSFWLGTLAGVAAALLATVGLPLLAPTSSAALPDELVAAHVHSLLPQQLIAVVSTDRHTVKPWFAGHADVSPAVADFAAQGYRLVGGRADVLARQRAAVVVYAHGAHIINVFSWVAGAGPLPADTTRSGYHLAFWQSGNLRYCAVADTGWEELLGLVRLLREQSAREALPPPE
jgi:anti-sigma factor (TIGR02949 family)